MGNLLKRLPRRPQPFLVRLAGATAIMAVCIGAQLAMARLSGLPGLFALVIGIFAVAVLLDLFSGYYAALLGTISTFFIVRDLFPQLAPAPLPVILLGVGIALATAGDALRTAMERAVAAQHANDVMFRELAQRVHGNLAIAISLLDMQGRTIDNPEVRTALSSAADRINIIAEGQQSLRPEQAGLVEMSNFLGRICTHIGRSIEATRSIEIDQDIAAITVRAEKAVVLGLVANELINNAIRFAFPGSRPGRIAASFARDDKAGELVLAVADDGIGCPPDAPEGFGSRLVQGLALQHGGRVLRASGSPGCRVEVRIPAGGPNG